MTSPLRETYYKLSAPVRTYPDFLIIGTQKGGTNSLHKSLQAHSQIYSRRKEVFFLDRHYNKGWLWYRSQFALQWAAKLSVDATVNYMVLPRAPEVCAELMPTAKLIVMLRNPIDRAFSHYKHNLTRNRPVPPTFLEAIQPELEKPTQIPHVLPVDLNITRYQTYLARSYYADQLENWFKYYPREQFLILKSEDYFEDPKSKTFEVCRFVGIDEAIIANIEYTPRNVGSYSDKVEPEVRAMLREHFAPHNQRLNDLIGMTWD